MNHENAPTPASRQRTLLGMQRRAKILETLEQLGEVRVPALATQFNVSLVTIRNDLEYLEKQGLLVRDHGGALPPTSQVPAPVADYDAVQSLLAIEHRSMLFPEAKQRIGKQAAALVRPGDTIFLDAGTTVVYMAKYLVDIKPLTVVTHALNVALEVGANTEAQVILLGGTLNRTAASTLGPLAEANLRDIRVQKLFLGTQAADAAAGLTDTTLEIAQIKRAMLQSAEQTVLLLDSSKWGRHGFIRVAPLTVVGTIISDTGLPTEAHEAIKELGIELVLV